MKRKKILFMLLLMLLTIVSLSYFKNYNNAKRLLAGPYAKNYDIQSSNAIWVAPNVQVAVGIKFQVVMRTHSVNYVDVYFCDNWDLCKDVYDNDIQRTANLKYDGLHEWALTTTGLAYDTFEESGEKQITIAQGRSIPKYYYIAVKAYNGKHDGKTVEKQLYALKVNINDLTENRTCDYLFANCYGTYDLEISRYYVAPTTKASYASLNIKTKKYKVEDGNTTCDDLSVKDLIDEYWNIVVILAPIALILLITIDFTKAVVSGDGEQLKKSSNAALKRTIATVVLLMLPLLLSILLGWFGIEFCI